MTTSARLERWFRLGYLARGGVWTGIGVAALATRRGQSSRSVMEDASALPLSEVLLLGLAIALAGLACFRLAEAWLDLDRRGDGAAGRLQRVGRAVGGLGYLALAVAAASIALDGPSSLSAPASAARAVRAHSGGGLLLVALSAGMIGAAVAQAMLAVTARFRSTLEQETPAALIWVGRAGYLARGVIFFLVGWHLLRAGLAGHRVRDAGAVLGELRHHAVLFSAVALGLLLFGLYSLAEARYRRIDGRDVEQRLRQRPAPGG